MAAYRYWRLAEIEVYGFRSDLELCELGLYNSNTRVDGAATFLACIAPATGALAALTDGVTSAVVSWAGEDVFSPGFSLTWDFGAGVSQSVTDVRIGSGDSAETYLYATAVLGSDDGVTWISVVKRSVVGLEFTGARAIATIPTIGISDPYASSVSVYLPLNGENTSTTIVDESDNAIACTVYAGAQISTAESKFGGSSLKLSASGDMLEIADNLALRFGTGDFTIEFWYNQTSYGAYQTIASRGYVSTGAWLIQPFITTGAIPFYYGPSATVAAVETTGTRIAGNWYHIAIVRAGTTVTIYRNGVATGSGTCSYDFNANTPIYLGYNNSYPFLGYIDDLRITKGVARYTADFTPPANALGIDVFKATAPLRSATSSPAYIAAGSVGETHVSLNLPQTIAHDVQFGGSGKIIGTVKEKSTPANVPLARRVRLIHEKSGIVVRETWSDVVTGAYAFTDIDRNQIYTALSYDHTHTYAPVAADNLTPQEI